MQQTESIQISLFGKMYPELSAVTKAKTSEQLLNSSAKSAPRTLQFLDLRVGNGIMPGASWQTVTALPGVSWTHNTGAFPSGENESTLFSILEPDAPERYYLSAKACAGILRRAEKRGKELPPMLKEALEEAVRLDLHGQIARKRE